jgi:hypothetical protein
MVTSLERAVQTVTVDFPTTSVGRVRRRHRESTVASTPDRSALNHALAATEACTAVGVVLVLTEWDEFRRLRTRELAESLPPLRDRSTSSMRAIASIEMHGALRAGPTAVSGVPDAAPYARTTSEPGAMAALFAHLVYYPQYRRTRRSDSWGL